MFSKLLDWLRGQGIFIARLETGQLNHAALRLYRAFGFIEIQPFPPYQADPLSVFMETRLSDHIAV
jgi:putative acetyltransferase